MFGLAGQSRTGSLRIRNPWPVPSAASGPLPRSRTLNDKIRSLVCVHRAGECLEPLLGIEPSFPAYNTGYIPDNKGLELPSGLGPDSIRWQRAGCAWQRKQN